MCLWQVLTIGSLLFKQERNRWKPESINTHFHPEVHHLDQFIRVEEGEGTVVLDGEEFPLVSDQAVIIPKGVEHNVINTGKGKLKLYSLYAPPEHKDNTIHKTKADDVEEHFDGVISSAAKV